jgi:acyl-CoA thioester hydrolase
MENPLVVPVQVRFRDTDPMGHVNNAVYATYLEEGRKAYYNQIIGVPLDEAPTVLASLTLDYEAPIRLEHDVRIEMRVDDLGGSSLPMTYEVYADDTLAARAETVQVVIDAETERAAEIPATWRTRIEAHRESRN